ncbi:hypothetical protein DFP73DRAFT_463798, partial [Morchella snyderi]
REKKDSWKKKEAASASAAAAAASNTALTTAGGGSTTSTTAAAAPGTASGKHTTGHNTPGGGAGGGANAASWPTLNRWRLPPPKEQDYFGHRAPPMMPATEIPDLPEEFHVVNDHALNRRGFRYVPCEASRLLPTVTYRQSEYEPFTPRINYEDMNAQVLVNAPGTAITTPKGWRMARANIGVREGDWYYECKILRGIPPPGTHLGGGGGGGGHVRVGWARREAPLDAPVGFDGHSYGLRDASGQKVHMSRPRDFLGADFVTGDVIGLRIRVPPLSAQRALSSDAVARSADIIRDRIPIRYKNQLWYEQFEYQPTKDMEELMNPSPGTKPSAPPRTLPGSCIKVYRNGVYVGTPWEDLYAFLPPASRPSAAIGGRELDDGSLGYYPAVSVFRGGVVDTNYGPDWWCPVEGLREEGCRPMCERYAEMIAEDVLWDVVDEVHL